MSCFLTWTQTGSFFYQACQFGVARERQGEVPELRQPDPVSRLHRQNHGLPHRRGRLRQKRLLLAVKVGGIEASIHLSGIATKGSWPRQRRDYVLFLANFSISCCGQAKAHIFIYPLLICFCADTKRIKILMEKISVPGIEPMAT